ncbi:MutS domain III [Desulfonispora thiosulfatigenes DSM 11270]|uniref:MutS domain III n=1 Tax=Desulfonispora thiosulfatigenes DSM 11270 TaxID=656914 RepID=A0A1W1VAE5_DESTI|nr:MutS family DNA mismatch repair protein [Desulfonispora thiosulfatigenes]SMB90183.1 MutS domain III [Desulfonispora thiosulfatigenes DSM 11270]
MKNPEDIYKKKKAKYLDLLKGQSAKINKLSSLRLIIALAGIVNIMFLYMTKNYIPINYILPIYLVLFTYLVVRHNKVKREYEYSCALHSINEDALIRLKGDWKSFKDTGIEFKDDSHSFSSDLDIFGQGSLFQYINTTTTAMGRQTLSKYLTHPCESKDQIITRQEAIKEVSTKLDWRQSFMTEGMMISEKSYKRKNNLIEGLYKFVETKNENYTKPWLIFGVSLLPVISIIFILLYLVNIVPYQIPLLALSMQAFISVFKNKERSKNLNLVYTYKERIKAYSKMLSQIEGENFKSGYLLELKNKLINSDKSTASKQIKKLEKITDNISNRSNLAFIIINILILWDYQCMISLELWKKNSGGKIRNWLETIGEFEALSSLSNIRYDNPSWSTPIIEDKPYHFTAKDLGHPLLGESRVCNDLKIDDLTKVLLITGSNMSGKSTYLRTAGINLVLAYAGAPVCAKEFNCSLFNIYTCMRVSDNLEKNTSSFYAELLRIKEIVDASKNQNVFFLLDEVFKGTNSHDRHEGAKILIKNLLENNAIGLVSTHDLELEVLEKESNKRVRNYHFEEYYKNNQIYFDYKLKQGISTTRNAMYLIKMVGIDG